jgi:GT2 family glycosyltransferase
VAAHNAGRTLDSCLKSLDQLNYPDYEVIVVNDGSRDNTQEIMDRYPQFRRITTRNQGVSGARNEGLRAATGEIVAYIDSDADADPDWLSHIANTYRKYDVVGVGGPNFVPAEDNWIAKCVYRSPGGPTQVMLDDENAEHIPGCNMTFLKSALDEIGEFDPQFRAAADDVDICWRLLDKGWKIGFAPSAVVWHHRRPSIKAYWKQQVGYGVSESLLERKFPNKFNPWGHCFWAGRIYAPYPFFRLLSRPVVYEGLWGSAPFQPMYEPNAGGGVWAFLPRAMEWHVALAALLALSVFFPWALLPFGLGVAYTILYCAHCAANANLNVLEATEANPTFGRRLKWRMMIAYLNLLEPLARDWGRLKGGLTPWRGVVDSGAGAQPVTKWWHRLNPFQLEARFSIPGNMHLEKFPFLQNLTKKLNQAGCAVGWNKITDNWDLMTRRGALAEADIRMVTEHHGGPKRLVRVAALIRPPKSTSRVFVVLALLAAAFTGMDLQLPAIALLTSFVVLWVLLITEAARLERGVIAACSAVARELQGEAECPALDVREFSASVGSDGH